KYNIILSNSDQNEDKEIRLIDTMLEKQVDGIVYMGGKITEEHIRQFETANVPVVLAATQDETNTLPSINIDYKRAAYEATNYLIESIEEQPAFVKGHDYIQSNGLKYEGYIQALQDASIDINEELIVEEECTYNGGIMAVEKLLDKHIKPKAIFVSTDEMAVGVIHSLQDGELRVPEDVEVFGFNNTRVSLMVRPTLTTIVQPMYDIGAVAMRLLTKYMNK